MPAHRPLPPVLSELSTPGDGGAQSLGKVQHNFNVTVQNLRTVKAQQVAYYNAEPKKEVTLSPLYRDHFGDTMTVSLNGISIYVPVNGRTYKVPASFAAEIHGRRRRVDDQMALQNKLADVTRNHETFIGELNLKIN